MALTANISTDTHEISCKLQYRFSVGAASVYQQTRGSISLVSGAEFETSRRWSVGRRALARALQSYRKAKENAIPDIRAE
jgi:hypothetical protein